MIGSIEGGSSSLARAHAWTVLEVLVLDRSVHRVALDRVAALHLDVLETDSASFRARDRELGQVDVEARRVDARGEVLAHLRRHLAGVLAALQLREVVLVAANQPCSRHRAAVSGIFTNELSNVEIFIVPFR